MPILNYTTQIAAEKTLSQIQGLLGKAGASAVMAEYAEGLIAAIAFRINHSGQEIYFRLPANVPGIHALLVQDDSVPKRLRTYEQATRVAWRIIKAWLEAQLALVEAEQAELVEVFLPYAQDPKSGRTLYQTLSDDGFKMLEGPK